MQLSPSQQRAVETNRREYAERYDQLTFPSPQVAADTEARRADLISSVAKSAMTGCGGTKLDMHDLSPGCRICIAGSWSCLFISGRCNARCFYCPTSQDETGVPTTNTVDFHSPGDYVAYLERFGFTGASISGGEPLLTPDRTLAFVKAIKRRFGAGMHVWLYTNGSLVNREILARLQDAGLDEIRFDIGAVDYRLDALRLAVGTIPTVTVEIPAIPEDLARMKVALAEMAEAGVNHLNLHQLRLTPYNFDRMVKRGYTFLHGDKITVLESELAALELLQHALDRELGLPVNYCSFVYKNRYQAQAARRRNATFVSKGFENLTAAGYLRTLTVRGAPADITTLAEDFRRRGLPGDLWQRDSSGERLSFHPDLWPLIDFTTFSLQASYATCRQLPAVSYRNPFVAVKIGSRKQVIVERANVGRDYALTGAEALEFRACFLAGRDASASSPVSSTLCEMMGYERMPEGLQNYY